MWSYASPSRASHLSQILDEIERDAQSSSKTSRAVLSLLGTGVPGPAAVLAATFGPVEVRPQRELVDRAFIEVTFRGHRGVEGRPARLTGATTFICHLHLPSQFIVGAPGFAQRA